MVGNITTAKSTPNASVPRPAPQPVGRRGCSAHRKYPASVKILGFVSESHDSGLALLEDGVIKLVLEEERLSREKHTMQFPVGCMDASFGDGRLDMRDIDVIAVPWDPVRLRRTFTRAVLANFPASLNLIWPGSNPAQDHGVVFINRWISQDLKKHTGLKALPPIVNVSHHDAHAAIFFASPFEEASVVVMDGYGDDAATSVYSGNGNRLERHWHSAFFDTLGLVYTFVTTHLGFQPFEEGTVMALAALGRPTYVDAFRDLIRLDEAGRYFVNTDYFSFDRYGALRPLTQRYFEKFGPARKRDEPLTEHHYDLAFALQARIEETVLHIVREIGRTQPSRNLCISGGVALNCVANAKILEKTDFERVWVPPCASDTGAPLGAALYHYHHTLGHARVATLEHPFYGLEYSDAEIKQALDQAGMTYERLADDELIARVARNLADDKIVGWFQGRFEMGPRALGNRSIMASPLKLEIKDIINKRVKYREPFRPFAPAVLAEHAHEYFEITQPDPFMTMAPRVRPDKIAKIPSAVHVDGTGRIQTVERSANPRYYAVIEAFGNITGVPVVLNTSFNKQEPIVARPQEAISCFLRTEIDVLVLGNYYSTDRRPEAAARAKEAFCVLEINTRGGE